MEPESASQDFLSCSLGVWGYRQKGVRVGHDQSGEVPILFLWVVFSYYRILSSSLGGYGGEAVFWRVSHSRGECYRNYSIAYPPLKQHTHTRKQWI